MHKSTHLLYSIIHYLRYPSYTVPQKGISFQEKVTNMLRCIFWIYGISAVCTIPPLFLFGSHLQNAVSDVVSNDTLLEVLLLAVIIAPFLEECAFRLPLVWKPIYVSIAFFLISRVATSYLIGIFPSINDAVGFVGDIVLTGVLFLVSSLYRQQIGTIYIRFFGVLLYASILLFGFAHLTNYSDFSGFPHVLIPLLVLPQTIAGIMLSFVRTHYGFWYGYINHAMFNFFLTIPAALLNNQNIFITVLVLAVYAGTVYGLFSFIVSCVVLLRHRKELFLYS